MRKLLVALSTIIVFFSACSVNNVSVDDSLGRFFDSAGVLKRLPCTPAKVEFELSGRLERQITTVSAKRVSG